MRNQRFSDDLPKPKTFEAFIFIFIFLLLCALPKLQAQTAAPATINANTQVITLDVDADFTFHYAANIGNTDFESQAAAEDFFATLSNKMVTFRLHPDGKVVDIYLNVRSKSAWKVEDWNTYLASLMEKDE